MRCSEDGSQSLVATSADGREIFRFEITDLETGAFTFTLLDQVDHPDASGDDAELTIDLSQFLGFEDADGDVVNFEAGDVVINVENDVPEVNETAQAVTATVQEDALEGGNEDDAGDTTSVTIDLSSFINVGADAPGLFSLSNVADELIAGLTSNGSMIRVTAGETGESLAISGNPLEGSDGNNVLFDVNSNSTPAFFDIDGDGDLDLISGNTQGVLSFFQNVSKADTIAFEFDPTTIPLITGDTLTSTDFGNQSAPTFFDLDGDGREDLIVGEDNGNLNFFRNTSQGGNITFALVTDPLLNPLDGIDVGRDSTPIFFDLDQDGNTDLITGETGGNLNFFRNTSSDPMNPVFSLVNPADSPLGTGAISNGTGGIFDVGTNSAPTFGDIDGDGDVDLVVGESTGNLNLFLNDGNGNFNLVDPNVSVFGDSDNSNPFDVSSASTPTFVDFEGDGDLDLIVGSSTGTFNFFRNDSVDGEIIFTVQEGNAVTTVLPSNPLLTGTSDDGRDIFTLEITNPETGEAVFTLLDSVDHADASGDDAELTINLSEFLGFTDADGDTVTFNPNSVVINVENDVPTLDQVFVDAAEAAIAADAALADVQNGPDVLTDFIAQLNTINDLSNVVSAELLDFSGVASVLFSEAMLLSNMTGSSVGAVQGLIDVLVTENNELQSAFTALQTQMTATQTFITDNAAVIQNTSDFEAASDILNVGDQLTLTPAVQPEIGALDTAVNAIVDLTGDIAANAGTISATAGPLVNDAGRLINPLVGFRNEINGQITVSQNDIDNIDLNALQTAADDAATALEAENVTISVHEDALQGGNIDDPMNDTTVVSGNLATLIATGADEPGEFSLQRVVLASEEGQLFAPDAGIAFATPFPESIKDDVVYTSPFAPGTQSVSTPGGTVTRVFEVTEAGDFTFQLFVDNFGSVVLNGNQIIDLPNFVVENFTVGGSATVGLPVGIHTLEITLENFEGFDPGFGGGAFIITNEAGDEVYSLADNLTPQQIIQSVDTGLTSNGEAITVSASAAETINTFEFSGNIFDNVDVGLGSRPVFVDIDGDGDQDLVVGEGAGTLHLFENVSSAENGIQFTATDMTAGDISPGVNVGFAGGFAAPDFFDFDGDGDQDIVVGPRNTPLELFENIGNSEEPVFQQVTDPQLNPFSGVFPLVGDIFGVPTFGDLDGDGDQDLLTAFADGQIAFSRNNDGIFEGNAVFPFGGINIPSGFAATAIGDIDGDGDQDVVVVGDENIQFLRNDGADQFSSMLVDVTSDPNQINTILVGADLVDIDGDGDLDLVAGIGSNDQAGAGQIRLFENTGTATAPVFVEQLSAANSSFVSQTVVQTLTGTSADGRDIFTLEITDTSTGDFNFTLLDQIDHPNGSGDDATLDIDLSQFITFTDEDGDSVAISERGGVVSVENDVPILDVAAQPVLIQVQEDALPGGVVDDQADTAGVSGSLGNLIEAGADAPGSFALNDVTDIDTGLDSQGEDVVVNSNTQLSLDFTGNPFEMLGAGADGAFAIADFDGDGDLDVVSTSSGNLSLLRDDSSPQNGVLFTEATGVDDPFAGFDLSSGVTTSRVSAFDFDGDGDQDLLFTSAGSTGPEDEDMLLLNQSAQGSNTFEVAANNPFDTLLEPNIFTTFFVDLNGDNIDELVFARQFGGGSFQTAFNQNGTFVQATGGANPLNGLGVSTPHLAFVDIDADGDFDLISGDGTGADEGRLVFFENTGSATNPVFVDQTGVNGNPFDGIDVGNNSTPSFADFDNDGDFDLIVGEETGGINFFLNTGTRENPVFVEQIGPVNLLSAVEIAALVGTAGDREIFTFEITDTSTGDFNFALLDQIDHSNEASQTDTETLDLSSFITFTDADGDEVTLADDTVEVEIENEVPPFDVEFARNILVSMVGDTSGNNSVTNAFSINGNIPVIGDLANFGGFGAGGANAFGFVSETEAEAFLSAQSIISGGSQISDVTFTTVGGDTVLNASTANGTLVFTIRLDDTRDGDFVLELLEEITQPFAGQVDISGLIQLTNGIGQNVVIDDGTIVFDAIANTATGLEGTLVIGSFRQENIFASNNDDIILPAGGPGSTGAGNGNDILILDNEAFADAFDGIQTLGGGDGTDTLVLSENITNVNSITANSNNTTFNVGSSNENTQVSTDIELIDGNGFRFDGTNQDNIFNFSNFDNPAQQGLSIASAGGDDRITGTPGDDVIRAETGSDIVNAGGGNDEVFGQPGNDELNGEAGDDMLNGGNGQDILNGGQGNDTLAGGQVGNTLTGGADDDLFILNLDALTSNSNVRDLITDYEDGERIDLSAILESNEIAGGPVDANNLGDFVQAVDTGNDTNEGLNVVELQVDRDGTGGAFGPTMVATVHTGQTQASIQILFNDAGGEAPVTVV